MQSVCLPTTKRLVEALWHPATGEHASETIGISGSMTADVVVEVRPDGPPRPVRHSFGPRGQSLRGVAPSVACSGAVEANVDHACGLQRRRELRPVPARIADLDGLALAGGRGSKKGLEPLVIRRPTRRKLVEHECACARIAALGQIVSQDVGVSTYMRQRRSINTIAARDTRPTQRRSSCSAASSPPRLVSRSGDGVASNGSAVPGTGRDSMRYAGSFGERPRSDP